MAKSVKRNNYQLASHSATPWFNMAVTASSIIQYGDDQRSEGRKGSKKIHGHKWKIGAEIGRRNSNKKVNMKKKKVIEGFGFAKSGKDERNWLKI